MPDKNYKPGCGKHCVQCWQNKLKHANPETKKFLKKINTPGADSIQNYVDNDERPKKRQRAFQLKPKLVTSEEV